MKEEELAYVAGVIDCDGSLSGCKSSGGRSLSVSLVIYNTDKKLLEKCQEVISGNITGPYFHQTQLNRNKGYYHLKLYKIHDLLMALKKVIPYMIVKKKKAKAMIEYLEYRKENFHKQHDEVDHRLFNKIEEL